MNAVDVFSFPKMLASAFPHKTIRSSHERSRHVESFLKTFTPALDPTKQAVEHMSLVGILKHCFELTLPTLQNTTLQEWCDYCMLNYFKRSSPFYPSKNNTFMAWTKMTCWVSFEYLHYSTAISWTYEPSWHLESLFQTYFRCDPTKK